MGEADNARTGFLGLTLRQAVVLGVIAYALVTGLFIAKNFNSSGKPIANKKLVTVVREQQQANALSEEEVSEAVIDPDLSDGLRDSLYHSPVVFGMNYEDMMAKFKVFIYPGDGNSFKALSGGLQEAEELISTDELFISQLYQSDFVTLDPEKAHLLLLPLSIRGLVDNPHVGPHNLGKWLMKYVQGLRDDYPYWARALGADHVVVTCDDLTGDGSRNVMELNKNAIQVACSPLTGKQAFFPHKDVAIPLYQVIPPPPRTAGVQSERSTLAYYHGDTSPDSVYASLEVSWKSDPLFKFEDPDVELAVHYERLSSSKFCLVLGPQDYPDIVGALKYGCVPVVVSDGKLYDLPFQDILDWSQFAIILSLNNAKKAKTLLSEVPAEQYAAMKYLAREASPHLEWHSSPVEKDAFYLTLYDLWMRRHAIRYVRREEL